MEKFTTLTSLAAPLDRANVDTDQIIPKQFLKRIERTGYGDFLFFDWRQTPDGRARRRFCAQRSALQGRKDSRGRQKLRLRIEPRACRLGVWSDFGFRAVIAPTFADIFFSNAGKNGIVLVRLSESEVNTLLQNAQNIPNYQLTVSLEAQTVTDGRGFSAKFEIDPFRKFCLLEGLDDIGLTLRHAAELDKFEKQHDGAGWLKAK